MSDARARITPRRIPLGELAAHVGSALGTSRWWTIDQDRVDTFADATGDLQWIHLDVERARESPYGSTIVHGFFVLSLIPAIRAEVFDVTGAAMSLNYGLERVRFPAALPVGRRLRARFELLSLTPLPGGARALVRSTFDGEGVARPVCVAEALTQFVAEPAA